MRQKDQIIIFNYQIIAKIMSGSPESQGRRDKIKLNPKLNSLIIFPAKSYLSHDFSTLPMVFLGHRGYLKDRSNTRNQLSISIQTNKFLNTNTKNQQYTQDLFCLIRYIM